MAFGFFKKTQQAEAIFYHGHIFTHDEDFPWADAVACADGRIIAVGDFEAMDNLIGADTQLTDLDGKYLFPGFIDVHRSPVMRVFADHYLDLSGCTNEEQVCSALADWAQAHEEQEILFGYGYREDCEPETETLDAVCADKPVVLLAASGVNCTINSTAKAIIEDTAEEECVTVITTPYILNLLVPFDFEQIEENIRTEIDQLCDRGITTVLNLRTPDYFEQLYQDSLLGLFNEGQLRQRFFGSYFLNRPLVPKGLIYRLMNRKTNCLEMGGLVEARTLHLQLDDAESPLPFSDQALEEIMLAVADKGFDFYVEAASHDDLCKAVRAIESVRSHGYRNVITLACDVQLSAEEQGEFEHCHEVLSTWAPDLYAKSPTAGEVRCVADAIDALTTEAAAIIGMADELGKIEKGRKADFTIFDENPLSCDLQTFDRLHAVMTVIDGRIVYDVEEENMREMYDLMASQHI